jgi:hypothetical protein
MAPKSRNKASMDAEAVARMMAAQDEEDTVPAAEAVPQEPAPRAAPTPSAKPQPMPAFDPGKIDGRTLRKTGREPFATRIKPETHEALRRIAYHRRITIAEALEMAVAEFDRG